MKRFLLTTFLCLTLVLSGGAQSKITGGKVTGGKLTRAAGGGGPSTDWLTITAWSGGTPGGTATRADFDGWVGAELLVNSSMSVTDLCRVRATGNASSHNVKIVRASDNVTVAGPVSVNVSSGTVGDFVCASITPVALSIGATYYLASSEVNGGDGWWTDTATTLSNNAAASLEFSVFSSDGTTGQTYTRNSGSKSYVPVNLRFQ